jgi:hypothetical protein
VRRIVAAAVLLLLAACSGGGPSAAAKRSAVKKSFITQADARCKSFNDRLAALEPLFRSDQAAAAKEAMPDFEALLSHLHGLPAPTGDNELAAILAGYDEIHANLRAVVAAKARDDQVVIQQRFDAAEARQKVLAREAAAYGFQVCGQL